MTKSITLPAPSGRWRRFVDWLAGGAPNFEKLEKNKGKFWFVRYSLSLLGVLFCLLGWVAPEFVHRLNEVPDLAALQTVQVRILRTHLIEPHLFVELPDGSQRGMEWPVRITGGRGGFRSYVWTDDERERLVGCLATVRGVPLRWTITDRFRLWELDCPTQKIHIGTDKTIRAHTIPLHFEVLLFLLPIGFHLFVLVIYLREKRGNL